MSIAGVDYAWSHPGGAALKAAGKHFACRYLSSDASKNLSKAEADDLAAHGISSVVVWETAANRALAGKAAGAADAKTAAALAKAAGMPAGYPIYFAVDFDATEGQQNAINAYLDGAASVLGLARVGIYGGYYPVKRALDAGKAHWAWQTIAWSGGQWDSRAHIRQGAQKTIGGVGCDLNTAMVSDYGQWLPGGAPKPATPDPEEDPMAGMTKQDIYDAVWATDQIKAPADAVDYATNKNWQAQSYLTDTGARVRKLTDAVADLAKTVDALAKTVEGLSTPGLTDAQVAQIGSGLASNPALVTATAAAVADQLAARLKD